ncbi:hypothetical protein QFC24_006738 [Naganishia onofrii]|uniref:Uncharacterized protein n=1 Tax=Naganishia onofrii TaxID=1851511 RepID=A0ACC2WZD3_9TREE|nr:hypothetical protein QFC24_006738 [Naganishia onofrii]
MGRNVPGVAVYFYLLNEIRYTLSTTGYFAAAPPTSPNLSPPSATAVPHTIRDASSVVGETFPAPPPGSIDLSLVAPQQAVPAVAPSSMLFSSAAAAGGRSVSGWTVPQEAGIDTSATGPEAVQRMTSALPKLNLQGNLVAGAVARTSVGFVLNPFTVLKSRYEVCSPSLSRLSTWSCVRRLPRGAES